MIQWIHDLPGWLLAIGISSLLTGFSWTGILVVRYLRRADRESNPVGNELVSTFLSAFGVLFGLALGLIAVETYSNHDEVDATVTREAAVLGTLYRHVSAYPEPQRSDLQAQLRDYCRFVIETAWPAQRRGEISERGTAHVNAFDRALHEYEPTTQVSLALYTQTLQQLDQLLELRRLRLHYVMTGLPMTLWMVVVIGSLLNLAMTWFFRSESLWLHFVLAGILSTIIGLMIFLIVEGDWPFHGELAITPEAFEITLRDVMGELGD